MSLYADAIAARSIISENGSKAYNLDRRRDRLVFELIEPYRDFYRSHPLGYLHFTQDILATVGARYLRIDTKGPNGYTAYGARLSMQIIEIRKDEDGLYAADPASDTVIARITDESFNISLRPVDAWRGFRSSFETLLPIDGPLLSHPACARLAALASSILSGPLADTIREIETIEEDLDAVAEAKASVEAEIKVAASAHLETFSVSLSVEKDLITLLDNHDWTFEEADRPSSASWEVQRRIIAKLAKLPIDDATALFIVHNGYYWYRSLSYFQNHPDLRKCAA